MLFNKSARFLFLFASFAHAATFLYFFISLISNALDGSHTESLSDIFPLLLFLLSFGLHLLPELRSSLLSRPLLYTFLTALITIAWVWLLSAGIQMFF